METAAIVTNDSAQATDTGSFQMMMNTQEGIYRMKDKGQKLTLALAKKVSVSKDGLTYHVTLRHANWSNGDPITAQNFVYGWRRTVTPATKSQDAFYFSPVKNADAIIAGKMSPTKLGIKSQDKYHFTITLAKPTAYFKKVLAFPLYYPQNQKVIEKYGKDYATTSAKQVYSGPFKLTKWNGSSDSWTLVKNNQYWDKKAVKLTKINETVVKDSSTAINLYNSGKLDEVTLTGALAQQQVNNKEAVNRLSANLVRLDLNQKTQPAFKDQKIRQALSLTINRQALVKNVLKDDSTAALGFVPVGLATNSITGKDFAKSTQIKSAVAFDLAKAKKLWQAGKSEIGITKLNITLLADDTDNSKSVSEYLQGALQKLPGLTVTVRNIPKAQRLQEQNSGNYDIVAATWQSTWSDPYNFLDIWLSNSSYNNSSYKSTKVDQLLDDSENKYGNDSQKRWVTLQAAERQLMTDQGTIPLYTANNLQLLKSKVKHVIFNPTGVPYDFKYASIR
ncbi:ABC-type oligopeptide transport system, periplasmic component [Lacticaseibacillus manihotivorans DSM 13343 = JCM 12514]|uniref:ABC-type oligopeptide transport system, periplasmic component n=2 Tax=Lacticaseibacillus manihotivorans TaxID=88233 RepID=A0A0R1R696_9LACO|nr:ABC-type oligopeptide transport system, periplasmic component [Lacticaseibacillus manihotivorans DSM 13343 = JCM 12514]